MTERYGPDDSEVPGWEVPPGMPSGVPPRSASGSFPPPAGGPPYPGAAPSSPGVPTYRSWQPGFMPLRPLTLSDFLSLPMKAISANRQVVLGGPLLCVVISILATSVAVGLFVVEQQDFFRNFDYFYMTYSAGLDPISTETILAIIVAVLVYIGADVAARTLVVPGVSRAVLGERITLGKAWSIARPRLPQVFLLYLLIGVVVIAGVLAIMLVTVAARALGVLLILAAIPAIFYFSVFTGVAVSACILEKASAATAFSRARQLMKGSAWRLIGNYLLISIILSFINNAIQGVAQTVILGAAFSSPSIATLAILSIVFTVIVLLLTTIIQYSFLGSLLTLMYIDLRIRTEGFDVDLARAAEATAGR